MVNHSIDVRCTVFMRLQSVEKPTSLLPRVFWGTQLLDAEMRLVAGGMTEKVWTKWSPDSKCIFYHTDGEFPQRHRSFPIDLALPGNCGNIPESRLQLSLPQLLSYTSLFLGILLALISKYLKKIAETFEIAEICQPCIDHEIVGLWSTLIFISSAIGCHCDISLQETCCRHIGYSFR